MLKHIVKSKVLWLVAFLTIFLFGINSSQAATSLASRLQGYILLQVESVGEAWYIIPKEQKMVYMKDGSVAYQIMREVSLGITNANLAKIPVGIEARFNDVDTDSDGLSDNLEKGLDTDPNKADTDNDGFSDGEEIKNNFSPIGASRLVYDNNLVNRLRGYILLQVEKQGQAWYLNPKDGKRYYMQDGPAAYNIMRYLSLGITNKNLNLIPKSDRVFNVSNNGNSSNQGNQNNQGNNNNSTSTPPNTPPGNGNGGGGGGGGGTRPPTPSNDQDNDGYKTNGSGALDCNDSNPSIHPGATEICGNNVDEDCSGTDLQCLVPDYDQDNDNYDAIASGGTDCNDSNPLINPGMTEVSGNNVDDNCNAQTDETSTPATDNQNPTTPTNLSGTTTGTQVVLTWTQSTDNVGVYQYDVERRIGTTGTFQNIVSINATSYTNISLSPSTNYNYRIKARDLAGNSSGYSNIFTITTNTATDNTPPSVAPANLVATPSGTQISLTWTAATDNVGIYQYHLERSTDNIIFSEIATPNTTSYTNTGLLSATTYYYRVRARDAALNYSLFSNTAQATTPVAVTPPSTSVSITGVTGTMSNGQTVSISGSGFGAKTTVAPVAWDNLEDGVMNTAATIGTWSNTGELSISTSNNRNAYSSYSAGYNFAGDKPEDRAYFQGGSDSPKWFAQYWFYLAPDFAWWPNLNGNLGNVKIFRLWSTSEASTNNLIVNTIGTFDILVNSTAGNVGFWNPVVAGHQTVNSIFGHANPSYVDPASLGWREFENDITIGTWHLSQFQYSESSMNGYDGTLKWWLDGRLIFDKSNIPTRTDAQPTSWRVKELGFYNSRRGDGTDTQNHFNLDDAYIDNTWSRVMLCNQSTWNDSVGRTCEIQPPQTIWNNNNIQIVVNQASFTSGQTAYLYVVDASGTVNSSGYPVVISGTATTDQTAPTTPTNLTVTVSGAQASLSWSASTDAVGVVGYQILRSTTNGSGYTQQTTSNTTSYTQTGLSAGTYYYIVKAYDAAGNTSNNSNQVTVTITSAVVSTSNLIQNSWDLSSSAWDADAIGVNPWSPITNFTFTSGQSDPFGTNKAFRIAINGTRGWQQRDSMPDLTLNHDTVTVSAYVKYGSAANFIFGLTQTDVSYTVGEFEQTFNFDASGVPTWYSGNTHPQDGHTVTSVGNGWYRLSVTYNLASRGIKNHPFSVRVTPAGQYSSGAYAYVTGVQVESGTSATTYIEKPSGSSDTQVPTTPTNLSASVSGTQSTLAWTASTDNTAVTGYQVLRSATNGSGYNQVATSNTNSYTNTGLTAGTYYYVVKAYDAAGNYSANSNQATVTIVSQTDTTPPSTPNILSIYASGTQVSLNWAASTDNYGVANYSIERSTQASNGFLFVNTTSNTSYIDTGLANSTTYYYRIRAQDTASLYSNYSLVVNATTDSVITPPTGSVSVSGVSGTTSNGQTVTISGSGFGTKSSVAPIVYDTVETGGFSPNWGSSNQLVVGSNTTNKRHVNSNYYGTQNFQGDLRTYPNVPPDGSGYGANGYFTGPNSQVRDAWYGRYWFKLDNNLDFGTTGEPQGDGNLANIKIFRLWNPASINENFVVATQGYNNGNIIYTTENTLEPTHYMSANTSDWTKNVWHVFDFAFKEGDLNASNGIFRMWFDGKLVESNSGVMTRQDFDLLKRPLILGFYNSWSDGNTDRDDFYIDDAYIDGTWSRVMLCDQSTWNDAVSRHCEIQAPKNTWSDSSIQITFNPGSFTSGQTAYIYVVDANGNVNSSGRSVVIN